MKLTKEISLDRLLRDKARPEKIFPGVRRPSTTFLIPMMAIRFLFIFILMLLTAPLIVLNTGCQSQLNMQEEQYTFWGKVMIVTP